MEDQNFDMQLDEAIGSHNDGHHICYVSDNIIVEELLFCKALRKVQILKGWIELGKVHRYTDENVEKYKSLFEKSTKRYVDIRRIQHLRGRTRP